MKKFLFVITSFLIPMMATAQKAEIALAKVKYNFIHIKDTNNRQQSYKEDMLLILGKNSSRYLSHVKLKQEVAFMSHVNEQIKNNGGTLDGAHIVSNRRARTIDEELFFFFPENKFGTFERLVNPYVIIEPIPQISWEVTKDTTSLSGIKCQKATAFYKGRNWIAWFAKEIPFQGGPWKLNGLPGLIIEAYDSKKEVQFLFDGFIALQDQTEKKQALVGEMLDVDLLENEIKIRKNAIQTSRPEFEKLKKARAEDPQGFAKAQLAGSPLASMATSIKSMPNARPNPTVNIFNNPIELP